MFDVKITNDSLYGSSGTMKATKSGKKKAQIKQVYGATKMSSFNMLTFARGKVYLLLITALLSQGSILTNDSKNNIFMSIDNEKVNMDT